ncbi:MAG: Nramp family divalent metal transporter [Bacteroidia bacterium]|nr:Nramp family divalent metal transporter [Bacteroidia bacterium]MDW8348103.1 Nramp family divalent metal transporter [Bacteroidia bacterium]
MQEIKRYLSIILPGILLAATGIGASDFFGATWAGTVAGTSILWAIILGVLLKYLLTVGMVKWQLYSGKTLLETWLTSFPKWLQWIFISYFLIWTILVCAALMGACGMAIQQFDVPKLHSNSKYNNAFYAGLHGILGWLLVRFIRFDGFEKVISFVVGFMFLSIVLSCFKVEIHPPAIEYPTFPINKPVVILAIISGIGGTVTLLSFSYWVKEKEWHDLSKFKEVKISAATGYIISGLFGACILFIVSHVLRPHGILADSEESAKQAFRKIGSLMGESMGRYFFISGFYAAVIGSMLGVWQSVPYFFANGYYLLKKQDYQGSYTQTTPYRYFQMGMILIAMMFLVQKAQILLVMYSLFGSLFMPMVAISLIFLNSKRELGRYKNSLLLNFFFVMVVILYGCIILIELSY